MKEFDTENNTPFDGVDYSRPRLGGLWFFPGEFTACIRTNIRILKGEERFHPEYLIPSRGELRSLQNFFSRGGRRVYNGFRKLTGC